MITYTRISTIIIIIHTRPPVSTLFPYTTLFRSATVRADRSIGPELGFDDRIGGFFTVELGAAENRLGHGHLLSQNRDRKSTRLNSSHANISYAVFCLKKKR